MSNDIQRISNETNGSEAARRSGELMNATGEIDPVTQAARCPAHEPGTMLNPLFFSDLAKGSEEVWIEGGGQLYRLRLTKQNKLILTK